MPNISFQGQDNQQIDFSNHDLPLLFAGQEGSGASFFSVSLAAYYYLKNQQLLIFTEKQLAKDQFLEQTGAKDCFEINQIDEIGKANNHQCIFIQSGNIELFKETLKSLDDLNRRIIFVKNIENTLDEEALRIINGQSTLILAGDLEKSELKEEINRIQFKTKISFSADRSAIMEKQDSRQRIDINMIDLHK